MKPLVFFLSSVLCWFGISNSAWSAESMDLRPKTLPRVSPSSQPKDRKAPQPKARTSPEWKPQIPGVIKKEQQKKRKRPWLLRTPAPFGISLIGGLTIVITGVALQSSDTDPDPNSTLRLAGEGLVAGGASLFLTVASAFMWWRPSTFAGVTGILLGVASLAGGVTILAGGIPGLSMVSGWSLLGTTVLHVVFNVVGWLNLKHYNAMNAVSREMRMQFQNAPPSKGSPFWTNVRVGPVVIPNGCGVMMSGKF